MKKILDAAALERALKRLSHEIEEKNDGLENVALIGIRTRGVIVAERIRRYIAESEGVTLPMGILDITLYRDDILSCDAVVKGTRIDFETKGKTLVLCDDVLFTGRTVRAAISAVMALCSTMGRAKKIQLLEVVDRGHRELPFRADFIGKNIPTSKKERCLSALRKRTAKKAFFFRNNAGDFGRITDKFGDYFSRKTEKCS